MEQLSTAIIILIGILVGIILVCVLMGFVIKLFVSGKLWNIMQFIGLAGLILYAYYRAGGYIYSFYASWVPFRYENKNMVHWDDVWYTIFIIFLIMMCSVFIKTVKKGNVSWGRLSYAIGVLGVLAFYTIMYYLYMYYDSIFEIMGYLTVGMIIMTGIVIFIKKIGLSYGMSAPFYMLYSVTGLTFIMAGFLFLFKIFGKCYDFLT
jgi:hypothetical protein